MEMPVPCPRCGEWVELHDTRKSPLTEALLCDECFSVEDEVYDLKEEADDIKYDLDNHAEHMKGDRRGWKKNLKELKEKIKSLGFDYDEL
ncbi:hypothetical protein [Chryseobacterium sp.]|uniref:hypothetical protein n=1 Tax=Chryseobacterium sp. TaxID=1871047 RepID=UPI00289A52E0|nr:hypothetical protein [Chryseobacterium sp.]